MIPETRFLILSAALLCSPWLAYGKAGTIVSVEGNVLIRSESGSAGGPIKAKPGDSIDPGHVINTASDASVKILMADKSIVDLGPSSLFKVSEYKVVDGAEDRKATMDLEYGKVRALVKKSIGPNGHFRIRTKSATMGVRGTEFVVLSDLMSAGFEPAKEDAPASAEGSSSAKPQQAPQGPQTKVVVLEGKVNVASDELKKIGKESVDVTQNQQVTLAEKENDAGEPERDPASEGTTEATAEAKPAEQKPVIETLNTAQAEEVREESVVEDNTFKKEIVVDRTIAGSGSGGSATMEMILPELGDLPGMPEPTAELGSASEFHGLVGQTVKLRIEFNGGGL